MNLQTLFKRTGEAITSVGFVIFFMLFLIIGMIFLSHTLFVTVLADTAMTESELVFASWFLALVFESTILITAVNTHHLNKALPIIFAVCSYFLLSFVLEAWTAETTLFKVIRHFIAVMGATLNYVYADLFQKKWSEAVIQVDYKKKYTDLKANYKYTSALKDEIQVEFNELRKSIKSKDNLIDQNIEVIKELTAYKNQVESSLICPYCNEKQESPASLRAHKGHCKKSQNQILN